MEQTFLPWLACIEPLVAKILDDLVLSFVAKARNQQLESFQHHWQMQWHVKFGHPWVNTVWLLECPYMCNHKRLQVLWGASCSSGHPCQSIHDGTKRKKDTIASLKPSSVAFPTHVKMKMRRMDMNCKVSPPESFTGSFLARLLRASAGGAELLNWTGQENCLMNSMTASLECPASCSLPSNSPISMPHMPWTKKMWNQSYMTFTMPRGPKLLKRSEEWHLIKMKTCRSQRGLEISGIAKHSESNIMLWRHLLNHLMAKFRMTKKPIGFQVISQGLFKFGKFHLRKFGFSDCKCWISAVTVALLCCEKRAGSVQVIGTNTPPTSCSSRPLEQTFLQNMQGSVPAAPLFSMLDFNATSSLTMSETSAKRIMSGAIMGKGNPNRRLCGWKKASMRWRHNTVKPPTLLTSTLLTLQRVNHKCSFERPALPYWTNVQYIVWIFRLLRWRSWFPGLISSEYSAIPQGWSYLGATSASKNSCTPWKGHTVPDKSLEWRLDQGSKPIVLPLHFQVESFSFSWGRHIERSSLSGPDPWLSWWMLLTFVLVVVPTPSALWEEMPNHFQRHSFDDLAGLRPTS